MKSIKVTLAGIVVILTSLFFMCIVIVNHGGGPDGLALGLFFVHDNGDDESNSKK